MIEAEMAWYDFEDMLKTGEGLIKHIVKRVLEEHKEDLETIMEKRYFKNYCLH